MFVDRCGMICTMKRKQNDAKHDSGNRDTKILPGSPVAHITRGCGTLGYPQTMTCVSRNPDDRAQNEKANQTSHE